MLICQCALLSNLFTYIMIVVLRINAVLTLNIYVIALISCYITAHVLRPSLTFYRLYVNIIYRVMYDHIKTCVYFTFHNNLSLLITLKLISADLL